MSRRENTGEAKLVFGINKTTGSVIHISDVKQGLACECFCFNCHAKLIAKKGEVRRHHFAHYKVKDCGQGNESFLHQHAKSILLREKKLTLPKIVVEYKGVSKLCQNGSVRSFDQVKVEVSEGHIRPDAIAYEGRHRLFVEFAVTNKCGPEKILFLKNCKVSSLEIDLKNAPVHKDLNILNRYILHEAPREWIYNTYKEKEYEAHRISVDKEIAAAQQREAALKAKQQIRDKRIQTALKNRQIKKEKERLKEKSANNKQIKALKKWRDEEYLELIVENLKTKGYSANFYKVSDTTAEHCDFAYNQCIQKKYIDAIGIEVPGDFCFAVPRFAWQAVLILQFVIYHSGEKNSPIKFKPAYIVNWINEREYLHEEFRWLTSREIIEIQEYKPDFRPPFDVIVSYFRQLVQLGYLNEDGHGNGFFVPSKKRHS